MTRTVKISECPERLLCSNDRSICLISDKILQRVIYNRLFLEKKKELRYSFWFGCLQEHSAVHALIHLTAKIRNQIRKGNYAYGISVDFRKTHLAQHIQLIKIESCVVRWIQNKWFASYLSNRKHYILLNGYKSNLAEVKNGVPQGSIFGSPFFLST